MKNNYIHNSNKLSEKLEWKYVKFFVLATLGGFFVGLGAIGYFAVLGHTEKYGMSSGFIAASIFPVGLIFCVFFGGSLFTSDSTITLKFFEKKAKPLKLTLICFIILIGNLFGSFLCAALSVWAGIYEEKAVLEVLQNVAKAKANMHWYTSIGSGVICNVLVAGAIWMINSLKRATPKIIIIWIVITLFVITGTQHVVANMYIFIAGWLVGAEFSSFGAIFENLLPTTVGNWISGGLLIPGVAFILNNFTLKEPFNNKALDN